MPLNSSKDRDSLILVIPGSYPVGGVATLGIDRRSVSGFNSCYLFCYVIFSLFFTLENHHSFDIFFIDLLSFKD